MNLTDQSFHQFIDLIYDAVEDPARWKVLYEALQQALDVQSVHVLALDMQHGTLSYSDGANMPIEGELAYMQHYRFLDPRLPIVLGRPMGAWMHCHEFISEEEVAQHPFYQEFLIPHDRRYVSACKLVDSPQATVVFATLSSRAQGPMGAQAIAFVDRLLPHLRRACRIALQHFVYSHQALVGYMLVNRLRQPVILMSTAGEVMHANAAMDQLLQSTSLIAVEDGRLRLPTRHLDELRKGCEAQEQLLKLAAAQGQPPTDGATGGQFNSLRITAARGPESVYAFYTVLSPQGAMGTFGLRPVVMLMFYHPESAPAIDPGLLYAVFGLSPAESRIAAMLAEGLSLKRIAQENGTQHETVRKQLQSIYQKTTTNRQPELVRLLLNLPHNILRP